MAVQGKGFARVARELENIGRGEASGFRRSWLGGVAVQSRGTYSVVFGRWYYVSRYGSLLFGEGLVKTR